MRIGGDDAPGHAVRLTSDQQSGLSNPSEAHQDARRWRAQTSRASLTPPPAPAGHARRASNPQPSIVLQGDRHRSDPMKMRTPAPPSRRARAREPTACGWSDDARVRNVRRVATSSLTQSVGLKLCGRHEECKHNPEDHYPQCATHKDHSGRAEALMNIPFGVGPSEHERRDARYDSPQHHRNPAVRDEVESLRSHRAT